MRGNLFLNSELDRLNMTVENLKQEELRFEEHKTNLEHALNNYNRILKSRINKTMILR